MKLLINICAHDGIISHYTGVGTMVGRYITEAWNYCKNNNHEFKINLFTPEYNINSFGYSEKVAQEHLKLVNTDIIQTSNGTNGEVNFGTVDNWEMLCDNVARMINNISKDKYDYCITICNDAPFAGLIQRLYCEKNHIRIWIPHSTIKIHKVDSAIPNSELFYNRRLDWEQQGIEYINRSENCFVGCIAEYLKNHLITEYSLEEASAINIINGENLHTIVRHNFSKECESLFDSIKNKNALILSFGRAEEYKNLDSALDLGKELGIPSLVVAQSYYKEQPILDYYKKREIETGGLVIIDPPFDFPKYVIKHFDKNMIVLIPSKVEIFGLIVNEVRRYNRDNIMVVANNVGGLTEQITDGTDGLLIDIQNISESANKIKKYFNTNSIKSMNKQSQKTLQNKYNFQKIFENFMNNLIRR